MAEMSMNRVIHGAFRRDLDRFVGALEAFPAGDRARAEQLRVAWDNFRAQLTHHHEGEHEIAWPALQSVGVSAELIASMDAEHEAMAAALSRAGTAMDGLRSRPDAEQADTALQAMRELRGVTVEHLDHEEREIEPVYLENRETPALKEMGKKFARAQGPFVAGRHFAWLLDGATPEQRAALTQSVPKPVLAVFGGVFGRRYRRTVAPTWR